MYAYANAQSSSSTLLISSNARRRSQKSRLVSPHSSKDEGLAVYQKKADNIIIHFLKKEGIEDKKCYKIAIEGTLTKLKC